jgi:hypothetical protein
MTALLLLAILIDIPVALVLIWSSIGLFALGLNHLSEAVDRWMT